MHISREVVRDSEPLNFFKIWIISTKVGNVPDKNIVLDIKLKYLFLTYSDIPLGKKTWIHPWNWTCIYRVSYFRYIPVGLLDRVPQKINERPPYYQGRNDLETLMASPSCADWVKIR